MLLRKLVVVGLVGVFSFAANIATAEDAVGPSVSTYAIDGVSFADPAQAFQDRFHFSIGDGGASRFSRLAPAEPAARRMDDSRLYELELIASAPRGIDVSFAQRGGVSFSDEGDIQRQSRASELRLGRGLRGMTRNQPSIEPSWYLFAASEDEALVWQPGARNEFGGASSSFALQDRVEIGDMQAGVTYEFRGVQASLAYVEREFSVRSGGRGFHQQENFTGITLTMRQ
ncbi:MAG: hypothetical protein R3C25_03680 [Hyphomonadaceae bacterium]